MGLGPVPAVRKVLARAGLKKDDIELFELNEAFVRRGLGALCIGGGQGNRRHR